ADEITAVESVAAFEIDEAAAEPVAEPAVEEIPAAADGFSVDVEPVAEEEPVPAAEWAAPAEHEAVSHEALKPARIAPERPATETRPGVLQEFVADLDSSLGDSFIPGTVAHEVEPEIAASGAHVPPDDAQPELESVGQATATVFGVREPVASDEHKPEVMGEFVADLEASLGDDFLKGAPVAESETESQVEPVHEAEAPVAASAPPLHMPAAVSAPVSTAPRAASAAAASSGATAVSSAAPSPVSQLAPASPKGIITPIIPGTPTASAKSPFGEDAGVDLAEMFGELKHDLEAGTSATEEDPETHY